jgi:hypothetical protein
MKQGSFDVLVRALDKAGVRYLVAGGLAVNAHGYLRFTRDVDLVLQLAPENIASAFGALEGIGYRPLDREMTELTFWCDRHRDTPVDVFVTGPFDFDEEYGRALVKPLGSVAWEGAEREQLRRWAQLSLEEIVRAQEEMQSLAERLARAGSVGGPDAEEMSR